MEEKWNEVTEQVEPEKMPAIFYKIYYQINKEKEEKRAARKSFILKWGSVAAIFVFAILLADWFITGQTTNSDKDQIVQLESPMGIRTKFYLPDGTVGWLNGNSIARYEVKNGIRFVQLKGKAFFDVAHDKKHPFRVAVDGMTVQVLGTEFGVTAYADDEEQEVTLKEGSVAVQFGDSKAKRVLKPDEHLIFSKKTNRYLVENVDAELELSWINGRINFQYYPLRKVVKILERNYHVKINVIDSELFDYSFYGTVENEPIESVLDFMQLAIPELKWTSLERKANKDGKLTKKEINLYVNKNQK
jgi:ferric-dicitrate binding protein FerR (iron transport regulator)